MGQGGSLCFRKRQQSLPLYSVKCNDSCSLGGGAAVDVVGAAVGAGGAGVGAAVNVVGAAVNVVGADDVDVVAVVVGADGTDVAAIDPYCCTHCNNPCCYWDSCIFDAAAVDVVGADDDDVDAGADVVGAGAGADDDDVGAGPYCCTLCKDPLCYWNSCAYDAGAGAGAVGADVDDVVVGAVVDTDDGANDGADDDGVAGADVPLAFKKRQLIGELILNRPSDLALKEVINCIHSSVRNFKPEHDLLVALYESTDDHVLRCIIADIFHHHRMEKKLCALPVGYKPPHRQVRNKEKRR